MEQELNYLSEKLEDLSFRIEKDLDYGYNQELIDEQLEEFTLLTNILNYITEKELEHYENN